MGKGPRRLCAELPQRPAEYVPHAGMRARLPGMRGRGAAFDVRRNVLRRLALPGSTGERRGLQCSTMPLWSRSTGPIPLARRLTRLCASRRRTPDLRCTSSRSSTWSEPPWPSSRLVCLLPEVHPGDQIVKYAQENGCGLIIMGSRGLGALRGMLGSVSSYVLREAQVPVLVVKAPENEE